MFSWLGESEGEHQALLIKTAAVYCTRHGSASRFVPLVWFPQKQHSAHRLRLPRDRFQLRRAANVKEPYLFGTIGYIPLKDPNFRYIPWTPHVIDSYGPTCK
jgi:hypothetical protein